MVAGVRLGFFDGVTGGGVKAPRPEHRPARAPALRSGVARRVHAGSPAVGRSAQGGKSIFLGTSEAGNAVALSKSGRILVDGKLAASTPGTGGDAVALSLAARLVEESSGLFHDVSLSTALRQALSTQLSASIDNALAAKPSRHQERVVAASLTLLIDLARSLPESESKRFQEMTKTIAATLDGVKDPELAGFYLLSLKQLLGPRLGAEVKAQVAKIEAELLPKRPLVEEYTKNRTIPLEVRHTIHPEFWKEELAYFSKKNGFTLVSKNAKDTERHYTGVIADPTGKKPPLKVNLIVRKDELDYLEPMSDPAAHVVLYSGHSALGGNGAQAIDEAGAMKGPFPKLVMAANCRGKDNYAAFTNKFPRAHVIMTEHPTYSVAGQARIAALFDTLARGESYAYMRKESEQPFWDEPADNYFYPDQVRKFRFMDGDGDGKLDHSPLGLDRFFDVDLREASAKFLRGVNFANSELFYHWEVDHENGKKSHFGKAYGDAVIADGALRGPSEGRLVRVEPITRTRNGKKTTLFRTRFDLAAAKRHEANLYAGLVTAEIVAALAQHKSGKIGMLDALRSVLMGAQAIHYLDVYTDTNPKTQRAFFSELGLTDSMQAKDVDHVFEKFDAHANDAQVKAFEALLRTKYHIDLETWLPTYLAAHAPSASPPVA